MKTLLTIIIMFGLVACDTHGPYIKHLSGNMMHVSTEYISDDETIDIYRDTLNSTVCYLYRYDHHVSNLSCVKDEMAFTR